ncbi:hypothetical protein IMZ48_40405 [Candidatus Bathyarchaeota archaeon]|nr:hypothetical protein [Candidatus Bathyarchaeota archaeon]
MAEQHTVAQPGPESTGVPDVAKAVDAADAAKAAVVHEAHNVGTFGKSPTPGSQWHVALAWLRQLGEPHS